MGAGVSGGLSGADGASPLPGHSGAAMGMAKPYRRRRVRQGQQRSARSHMLKFIGGTIGFVFLIGLLVIVGILMLIF
jgi:hypothetical protein